MNGGQTTAPIYFTKKKTPEVDLRRVRVPDEFFGFSKVAQPSEERKSSGFGRDEPERNIILTNTRFPQIQQHAADEVLVRLGYAGTYDVGR